MGKALNAVKMAILRTGSMTISHFPFLAVPTVLAFQCDMAYGTKMERIYKEARSILRNEKHWFNEPMALPPYLEPHYRAIQDSHNEKLIVLGRQPDKEWARFEADITDSEILDHTYPITKTLAQRQYSVLYDRGDVHIVRATDSGKQK